jgi:hypothetical protein
MINNPLVIITRRVMRRFSYLKSLYRRAAMERMDYVIPLELFLPINLSPPKGGLRKDDYDFK